MTNSDAILDLYGQGYSKGAICKTLRASPLTVGRVLSEAGLSTGDYHKMEPELVRVVHALLPHGVFYRDMEACCDISADAVRDMVARYGYHRGNSYRTYLSVSEDCLSFPAFPVFVRRYQEGESFPALIQELGVSDDKIYPLFWYVWSEDLSGAHREQLALRVTGLLDQGVPAGAVAHQLHVSPSIVRHVARSRC